MSQKFGSALIKKGYGKKDVLGILLANCPQYILAFTGAAGVGMTVSTFNPAYTSAEISKQLIMSQCKAILTSKDHVSKVSQAIQKIGQKKIEIILIDQEMEQMLQDDGSAYPNQDSNFDFDNDVVLLPYSSGTSKGANKLNLASIPGFFFIS